MQWIRFVGYELRFDGQARISRASIKKHIDRMRAELDALFKLVCPDGAGVAQPRISQGVRKRGVQIIESTHWRIIGMSTGWERQRGRAKSSQSISWLSGFPALKWNPALEKQLRALETARDRQLKRLPSKLNQLEDSANGRDDRVRNHRRKCSYVRASRAWRDQRSP